MSKYIDVDALSIGKANRDVFNVPEYADGFNSAIDMIMNEPAADVAPVIHAFWRSDAIVIDDNTTYYLIGCSVCGRSNDEKTPYCPHCGARMEGVSE